MKKNANVNTSVSKQSDKNHCSIRANPIGFELLAHKSAVERRNFLLVGNAGWFLLDQGAFY